MMFFFFVAPRLFLNNYLLLLLAAGCFQIQPTRPLLLVFTNNSPAGVSKEGQTKPRMQCRY
jgi:hypothetical protein